MPANTSAWPICHPKNLTPKHGTGAAQPLSDSIMSIEIRNIHKQFGDFQALGDVSLDIQSGELIALLGPSGCGKTTLLRIIAGLESADSGTIWFSGEDTTHVHVRERQVGFVFQHYALFRHMTVFENVAFGLRVKPRAERPSEAQIKRKVHDLLSLVQLDWLADRYPSQLSGGQRQRIALARALAVEPKVLLLDEPFGALDAKVRKELRRWLRHLHEDLNVTTIFVTHDQEEALEVADRVVVMNKGEIVQTGSPQQVWEQPANPFVYGFLGDVNVFKGHVHAGEMHIEFEDQRCRVACPEHEAAQTHSASAYVRPYDLDVHRPQALEGQGLHVKLSRAMVVGGVARLELVGAGFKHAANGQILEAQMSDTHFYEQGFAEGDHLVLVPRKLKVFAE
jgi:sulfate/thiosulfate transport system ATP-binding protein